MHGSIVDTALRSAEAWIGNHDWSRLGAPDHYDHRVWGEDRPEVLTPSDAVLVHAEPGLEVYDVRYVDPIVSRLFHQVTTDPKEWYPTIDKRTAQRAIHPIVFLFGDRDEMDLRSSIGEPPVDGYLVGLFVIASDDRLLPVQLQWRGRQLDRLELSSRVGKALSYIQNVRTDPKVPAPVLPPEVLDSMVEARTRGTNLGHRERTRFVQQLMVLDRTSFLEVLGRMFPWIDEGEVGWLDKDDQVADRLWDILGENGPLRSKMRLAPWKTGLGEPKGLRCRVVQDSSGPMPYHERSIDLYRTDHGPFDVVGGRYR